MQRKILAAALFALFALGVSPSYAAKCYIREYNTLGQAQTTGSMPAPAQVAMEPGFIGDQVTADFSGGPVQSNAFNSTTSLVRLWCDTQASFLFGTNPTAANTNAPIAALTPEYFGIPVNQGYKLSVHANP